MQKDLSERAFAVWALACALGYLALQIAYLRHLPLVTDEFDGAFDVYRLRSEVPYLDFAPYKTVVGYYLQLVPLLLGKGIWSSLFNVKYALAGLNTLLTLLAAYVARPLFSRLALALALPPWLFMSNWLERSADLRVDTLTTWPGLFSVLVLLRGRPVLAGLLCALSFLISQKGIYFIAASGVALAAGLLVRQDKRAALLDGVRFGAACLVPIGLYFGTFSLIASAAKTTRVMFMSHQAIALTEIYPNIRKFWRMSLLQNPGLYAFAALGLIGLAGRTAAGFIHSSQSEARVRETQLFAYCATLTAGFIWHKQPWPYFFVLLGPTAFILCAAAVEYIARPATTRTSMVLRWAVIAIPLGVALVMPVLRAPVILRESNAYQRHMVEMTAALTADGTGYIAGMDLLFDRKQSARALRRLSISQRRALDKASDEAVQAIIDELEARPPKVLVRNERFNGMPRRVKRYLEDRYAQYWGNLELYAPRIAGNRPLVLSFAGSYRVELEGKSPDSSITVDGRELHHGDVVELAAGPHTLENPRRGRLRWQPPKDIKAQLDPRFRKPGDLIGNGYGR